jgi:hypothetical protein
MENHKTCVAMICGARWNLPSSKKTVHVEGNVHVADWPTDALFIKNCCYGVCGLPGQVWDEHACIRAEDEAGWLCAYHAHGDESTLPTATVAELLDVDKVFEELNAGV